MSKQTEKAIRRAAAQKGWDVKAVLKTARALYAAQRREQPREEREPRPMGYRTTAWPAFR